MTGKNLEHRLQGDVFLGLFKCNRTLNVYKTYTRGRGPYREVMREYGKKKNLLVKPTNRELFCVIHDERVEDDSMLGALNLQFGRRVRCDEKKSIKWIRVTNGSKTRHEALSHLKNSCPCSSLPGARASQSYNVHFQAQFPNLFTRPFPTDLNADFKLASVLTEAQPIEPSY